MSEVISIGNISVDVVRKNIKNMHLAVYPPDGGVRLSAPEKTDPEVVRLFAVSKLGWIKKHVRNFKEQERETPRKYVSGESHYYQGKRLILEVREKGRKRSVELSGTKKLILTIPNNSTLKERENLMQGWYRKELKHSIPPLLEKWQSRIRVEAKYWGVKIMKTKWGSCNPDAKRIWLNLELAKKPQICLEYIIVHELVHLLERHHNDKFIAHIDEYMPKWRLHRDELNSLPVRHEDWGY